MIKLSSMYICQQCGFKTSQFLGKCPECETWGSLVEETAEKSGQSSISKRNRKEAKIIDLASIEKDNLQRLSTKIEEFDRVLGGGIVAGSLVLISGDPGIGKSTLLTQLAINLGSNALYVAGEESARQIKLRTERICPNGNLKVLNETDVDLIISQVEKEKPTLTIIDSIQTLETADLNGIAGSVGQVRETASRLQKLAKRLHLPIFLVGHITKEGTLAGPKTLEHLVDVVLSLEGETNSSFRILRSTKNRFGPTDEVGIFEMAENGMIEIKNPSKTFLEQKVNAPGSVVAATLNGLRPLLVEIQALVSRSFLPIPKRIGLGIDNNRLQLLTAVLAQKMRLPLLDKDIFVNVTGGLKIWEPAVDLAICLAIISSLENRNIDPQTVCLGEVGLLGEVRRVKEVKKRVAEAKKLGLTKIISPDQVKSLEEAVRLAYSLPITTSKSALSDDKRSAEREAV